LETTSEGKIKLRVMPALTDEFIFVHGDNIPLETLITKLAEVSRTEIRRAEDGTIHLERSAARTQQLTAEETAMKRQLFEFGFSEMNQGTPRVISPEYVTTHSDPLFLKYQDKAAINQLAKDLIALLLDDMSRAAMDSRTV